jgi:hypothetical protein
MAYTVYSVAGAQPIANTETAAKHNLGQMVRGYDPTYGEGEFIYLLGVASTEVGFMVIWNATTYQTALVTVTNGKGKGNPVGIAMSANVAAQYGWYQVQGNAVIKKTTVACLPQVPIFISATTGRMKTLLSAGQQILGAQTANLTTIVSTTSTVVVTINRPHTQGQIV